MQTSAPTKTVYLTCQTLFTRLQKKAQLPGDSNEEDSSYTSYKHGILN